MSNLVTRRDRLNWQRDLHTLYALRLAGILRDPVRTARSVYWVDPTTDLQAQIDHHASQHDGGLFISRKFPEWSRTTPRIKATYGTVALGQTSAPRFMTVRLGPNRIDRARKDPRSFLRSVKREMDAKLYRRLDRKLDYWFIVETSVTSNPWGGRTNITDPHIHGVIGAASAELEAVEEALRSLAGDYGDDRPTEKGRKIAKRLAVELQPVTNSLALAGYVTKDPRFAAMCVHGNNFTQTRNLNAIGKANYEFHTKLFGACKSAMTEYSINRNPVISCN